MIVVFVDWLLCVVVGVISVMLVDVFDLVVVECVFVDVLIMFGGFDVLVNNVGIVGLIGGIDEIDFV